MRCFVSLIWIMFATVVTAFARSDDEISRRMDEALARYQALPPSPLNLDIETGQGKPSKAMIGVAGGSISLETDEAVYTLTIPEDALFFRQEISLTPVKTVKGLGDEAKGALAVKIGPSGLPVAAPAWLNIKPKQADLFDRAFFPFGFSGDGANAHYSFVRREADGAVAVMVTHFSGFGTGLGTVSTQALSQSKLSLDPPDPNQAARDAAAIGEETHGWWQTAVDAVAGDPGGLTAANPVDAITRAITRKLSGPPSPPPGKPLPEGGCGRIGQLIQTLNVQRAAYPASEPQELKVKLEPSQWEAIKACAKPPAELCYSTGNPWPLVAYLKALRAYHPDPKEQAEFRKVEGWLESLLSSCARYQLMMLTESEVNEKTGTISLRHNAELMVYIDLEKIDGVSKEVYVGKGSGTATNIIFECKVKGAKCTAVGTRVENDARIEIDLGDLPFDGGYIPGAGESAIRVFNPALMPAFVRLATMVRAKGIKIPIEFEMVYSFWRCNFKDKFVNDKEGFRFGAWDEGAYPVLFKLNPEKRSKACGGERPLTTDLKFEFLHRPLGTYQQLQ